jgi:hypothetical protein
MIEFLSIIRGAKIEMEVNIRRLQRLPEDVVSFCDSIIHQDEKRAEKCLILASIFFRTHIAA